jgi:hypothetical protein
MKNTFQMLRDLPNYPLIVTRTVAIFMIILAVPRILIGIFFITGNQFLGNLLTALGMLGSVLNSTSFAPNAAGLASGFTVIGVITVLEGLLLAYVAIGILQQRRRILAIILMVIYLGLWIMGPDLLVLYVLTIVTLIAILLFLFDNRIKAYFGQGPFATQYWQWRTARRFGSTTWPSPWSPSPETPSP